MSAEDRCKLVSFLDTLGQRKVPRLKDVMGRFKKEKVVIYGAGCYGSLIYSMLSEYGVGVEAFLDIKSKPGDTLLGIPMYKADDALIDVELKKNAVVIVALVKDYETRESVYGFIRNCGFKNIVDAQSIRCHYVDFDDMDGVDDISTHIENNMNDILRCFDLFQEDYSQGLYVQNAMAHLGRNYDMCLESIGSIQYCPDDIPFNKGYERFVDCGGYIGDTIEQLQECGKNVRAAVIFEPNLEIFPILSLKMNVFAAMIPELYLYPCAISDKTEFLHLSYFGGSSTLSEESDDNHVLSVSLDDVLKNFAPTFIKMDIEGAEVRAINGAKRLIMKYHPDLAISVYHNINHLWDIPLLINSWDLCYDFYLRCHNSYTMETILYATKKK